MFKPLFYAVCGAAGFCLSFVIGIFSRATFAIIFARALVFGALFASLAFLFHCILSRVVPDLFDESPASAPEPESESESPISSLDITIEDEDESFFNEDFDVPDFMQIANKSDADESLELDALGELPAQAIPNGENNNWEVGKELSSAQIYEATADFESEGGEAIKDVSMDADSPVLRDEDFSNSGHADAGVIAKAISTVLAKE